jgi:hypothetical protein
MLIQHFIGFTFIFGLLMFVMQFLHLHKCASLICTLFTPIKQAEKRGNQKLPEAPGVINALNFSPTPARVAFVHATDTDQTDKES